MKSRTKIVLNDEQIKTLFKEGNIFNVTDIYPLGEGEYNAAYSAKNSDGEYVIKISPPNDVKVLTYEKNMMKSELYWYDYIKKNTTIDTPKIYYQDFSRKHISADYFIMEKIDGVRLDKVKLKGVELSNVNARLPQMAAEIHTIKNDKFGYIQNQLFDSWYDASRAIVENLINDAKSVNRISKRGEKLLSYIDKNKELLKTVNACMVNFDLGKYNVLYDTKNKKLFWIDPERGLWGDKIMEFVCFEFSKPLEKKTISLSAYNKTAKDKIFVNDEEKLRFGIALGIYGLIVEVEKYYRYSLIHFGWWRNVIASKIFFNQAFKYLK